VEEINSELVLEDLCGEVSVLCLKLLLYSRKHTSHELCFIELDQV